MRVVLILHNHVRGLSTYLNQLTVKHIANGLINHVVRVLEAYLEKLLMSPQHEKWIVKGRDEFGTVEKIGPAKPGIAWKACGFLAFSC